MEIREAFSRAREGDSTGDRVMQRFAAQGSKAAEGMLLIETKKLQANSPSATFAEAFKAASELYPDLHLAYLNGNGLKRR